MFGKGHIDTGKTSVEVKHPHGDAILAVGEFNLVLGAGEKVKMAQYIIFMDVVDQPSRFPELSIVLEVDRYPTPRSCHLHPCVAIGLQGEKCIFIRFHFNIFSLSRLQEDVGDVAKHPCGVRGTGLAVDRVRFVVALGTGSRDDISL